MSHFLRLLNETDKAHALVTSCARLRQGETEPRHFEVAPESFDAVPGRPFAYWVSEAVRGFFGKFEPVESGNRRVALGLSTKNDARFVRTYWEVSANDIGRNGRWFHYANGGSFSRFYYSYPGVVLGSDDFSELRAYISKKFPYLGGNTGWILHDENNYLDPVIAWPLRTHAYSPHFLPEGFVFSARTYAAYIPRVDLPSVLGLLASTACDGLLKVSLGRSGHPEFVTNVVRNLPLPSISGRADKFASLVQRAWMLKRTLDTVEETSHAFLLPVALRTHLGDYDPPAIEAELSRIQAEIDEIAFDLYGFSDADRAAITHPLAAEDDGYAQDEADNEDEAVEAPADTQSALLSWAVGVAFGRFDWRLATGERTAPPVPEPFDPLPAKSPGMLPDDADPFHHYPGLLVDDPGHPHDLTHLVEEVLTRVETLASNDVRRWLQRDFFAFHLQRYSKSRRKAPIYWPLATASGSYTLWIYYPSLTSQTLYTAINDFVEPKLKQVGDDVTALRNKGPARTRDDEKQFEALQAFELELIELRDTLLKLAPTYKPNHDDGVQITAAPLWPLFRHKPWQKLLKETLAKLEKGDYEWAHLAMNYRPNQVREKCKTDKSLAIAHGLEDLYVEPDAKPKKGRGQKKATG